MICIWGETREVMRTSEVSLTEVMGSAAARNYLHLVQFSRALVTRDRNLIHPPPHHAHQPQGREAGRCVPFVSRLDSNQVTSSDGCMRLSTGYCN